MVQKKDKQQRKKLTKGEIDESEIQILNKRCENEAPPSGSVTRKDGRVPVTFEDVALSQYTMSGLNRGKFTTMTKVQQLAIPHALYGRDIMGAARTGSGKTLAFLIPVLERLFRAHWSAGVGVGAIVISPTRELALQIFEVLRVVGYRHSMPGGLVIGGSDFRKEQQHISQVAILVGTPGRLLQHLEQTPDFDASQTQTLVLDEADRLLDLGFKEQLTQIVDYLPKNRQTMLFSATQTKSIKALAKLSLRNPEYISIYDAKGDQAKGSAPTPASLVQVYSLCQLPDKMDILYSFIRSHLKSKVIVFLSSCNQVRYVNHAFSKLRPGIPLMCIHGKIKQGKRLHIYYDFIKKPAAILFATDIAARGLDFPNVDWIVQADCPEDVPTYIHRVGRTARYKSRGCSLMLLLPNEAPAMVKALNDANIPIKEKHINPNRQTSITSKLQSEVAKDTELQMVAQKAFKSYLRSVYLQSNKELFDIHKLPMGNFAQSFGLATTPRLKFLNDGGEKGRKELRKEKNKPRQLRNLEKMEVDDDEDVMELLEKLGRKEKVRKSKYERLIHTQAGDPVSQHNLSKANASSSDDDDSDSELVIPKSTAGPLASDESSEEDDTIAPIASKKQLKRIRLDTDGVTKGMYKSTRKEFDDEGNEISPFAKLVSEMAGDEKDVVPVGASERQLYLERITRQLQDGDAADKLVDQERVKSKHKATRDKLRQRKIEDSGVVLGASDNEPENQSDDESSDNESEISFEGERPAWAPPPKKKKKQESDVEAAALKIINGIS